jgi:cytoskeletal protein CcmA (bactofilin family)
VSNQRIDVSQSSVPDAAGRRPSDNGDDSSPASASNHSVIGKSIVIKGEITGTESIHIEGTVDGSIVLPNNRVTVRSSGRISADITAQDIVVMGELIGNCEATDHVYVRSEGSICGNIVAARISVEDGAYLTGTIDIRREATPARSVAEQEPADHELLELAHAN